MKTFNSCLICGNSNFSKTYLKKWENSNFSRCGGCGLIFQNPQECREETHNRYKEEYFQYEVENEQNFFNLIARTIDDFRLLDLIPSQSNILEIGSATGLFLKYMDEKGHKSTGIEICTESVEYGRKTHGVNLINLPLEEAVLEENSFDFIHFSHLIEHLNEPGSFLEKVYSLLKKGGYIIVTTPNSSGLFSGYYKDDWRCIVDDHLFLFNRKNLISLLKKRGFTITRELTWGSIPAGKSPVMVKRAADWFVKRTKLGDVVSILAKK